MIELNKFKNTVINEGNWVSFPLRMTGEAINALNNEENCKYLLSPAVYVHVGNEGELENKVLRIGRAASGILNRWIEANNGHCATLDWATGKSTQYGEKYAKMYMHYLLFFASLYEMKTTLHVLILPNSDEDKKLTKVCESILEGSFCSVWDNMMPKYKSYSKKLPIVAENGAAIQLVQSNLTPELITKNVSSWAK